MVRIVTWYKLQPPQSNLLRIRNALVHYRLCDHPGHLLNVIISNITERYCAPPLVGVRGPEVHVFTLGTLQERYLLEYPWLTINHDITTTTIIGRMEELCQYIL